MTPIKTTVEAHYSYEDGTTITFRDWQFSDCSLPFRGIYNRAKWKKLAEIEAEISRLEGRIADRENMTTKQDNIMNKTIQTPQTCPSCSSPIISGPRIPLVYGSAATEICTNCLAWRTTHHRSGKWRRDSLEAAIRIRTTL